MTCPQKTILIHPLANGFYLSPGTIRTDNFTLAPVTIQMEIRRHGSVRSPSLVNGELSIFFNYFHLLGSNQKLMGYVCCVFIALAYLGCLGLGSVLEKEIRVWGGLFDSRCK